MKDRTLVFGILLPALLDGCGGSCGSYEETWDDEVEVTLEELTAASDANGDLTSEGCRQLCGPNVGERLECRVGAETGDTGSATTDEGRITVVCTSVYRESQCDGRAHAALLSEDRPSDLESVGGTLARSAWDEAASIGSFRRLARELERHGAPSGLVARAREAALDEVRHARVLRELARDHGVRPSAPRFRPTPSRDLTSIAVENAVEGCVRETFAALVVHHQARRAVAPLRGVFARIAVDETRHAQWSWDLDVWLRTRLSAAEQARVDTARDRAFEGLAAGMSEPVPSVGRWLGLPSAALGRRLVRRLREATTS